MAKINVEVNFKGEEPKVEKIIMEGDVVALISIAHFSLEKIFDNIEDEDMKEELKKQLIESIQEF